MFQNQVDMNQRSNKICIHGPTLKKLRICRVFRSYSLQKFNWHIVAVKLKMHSIATVGKIIRNN